ncbi:hypothetical protein R3P38DRAFT_3210163 [Favolaschia claudopus]|uniref:Uncharacterized protein n=1 Tax=Favolaschia claudopus TaxID=2862362 RepID=A0AAW0AH41_9AGAR
MVYSSRRLTRKAYSRSSALHNHDDGYRNGGTKLRSEVAPPIRKISKREEAILPILEVSTSTLDAHILHPDPPTPCPPTRISAVLETLPFRLVHLSAVAITILSERGVNIHNESFPPPAPSAKISANGHPAARPGFMSFASASSMQCLVRASLVCITGLVSRSIRHLVSNGMNRSTCRVKTPTVSRDRTCALADSDIVYMTCFRPTATLQTCFLHPTATLKPARLSLSGAGTRKQCANAISLSPADGSIYGVFANATTLELCAVASSSLAVDATRI